MVQPDRQGLPRTEPAGRVLSSRCQRGSRRSGSRHGRDVRGPSGRGTEATQRTAADGTYRPQAIRRHYIPKPGTQENGRWGYRRCETAWFKRQLRRCWNRSSSDDFAEHSYGFRPGRGCKDALRRVDELLKAGYTYVVDADLKSYFDTIPHDRLMALVGQKVSDGRVLRLIEGS